MTTIGVFFYAMFGSLVGWLVGNGILIAIGIIRQKRAKVAAEPANSHPGRVVPPGMPITRALKNVADDLRELQDQPSPREAKKDGATPGEGAATLLPFRLGQWLRRKLDGALVEYTHPSVNPGHFLAMSMYGAHYPHFVFGHNDAFDPALPREGEWWQKMPCPKLHPLPKDTAWCASPVKWCYTVGDYTSPRCGTSKSNWDTMFAGERDACECGCLVPVNFGCGEATKKEMTVFPRMRIVNDHAKTAERPRFRVGQWVRIRSTGSLAKLISAGGESWWSVEESVDQQLYHVGTLESNLEPALPREGEWWESDHVGITREPFQWERQGVFVTFGDADIARCVDDGCLRPVNFGRGK